MSTRITRPARRKLAEHGISCEGMTLTCIGFCPLPDEIAHQISHKYQLY